MAETKKIVVNNCARCGENHEIVFKHFAGNSFEDSDGTVFNWWGICPATGDPVLMTNRHTALLNPTPDDQLPPKPQPD